MREQITSYETDKLAKEKGFNYPVPHCYCHNFADDTYNLELFSFLLGTDGYLANVYENEKKIRNFKPSNFINEAETFFDYNQDLRRILVRTFNGEEYMDDEKCLNFNIDSYTYHHWTAEEAEANKILFPNYNDGDFDWTVYSDVISAPTQSLLQKWLREIHNLHICIELESNAWHYIIKECYQTYDKRKESDIINDEWYMIDFDTYEDALETALQEALKLIKC